MKKFFAALTGGLLMLILTMASSSLSTAQSGKWATAYYAGWQQGYNNTGRLPAQNIDFSAITHICHFALVPRSDGTLDETSNSVTAYNANAIVTAAHAAGKKVLITVGGWNSESGFAGATSSANVSKFITNLVNLMKSRGYDGIDIDWEPISSTYSSQFVSFINQLRTALDAISPRPLLTAASGWGPSIFAQTASKFDQINLMTYDMSGAWPGWVTWHNSPVSDGGYKFPSTGKAVPSADGKVNEFIAAGVPASKLGIGIDFYGYVWSGGAGTTTGGVTEPRQSWTTAPSVQANVPYYTIMDNYYQSQYYRFDNAAGTSYLSIDNSGSSNDKFISYDDEATVAAKFNYIKSKGIGGAIIWELGGGYRTNMPVGQKDKLLQAVKTALGGSGSVDATPPSVSITSPANGISVTGVIAVTATASDNVGVAGVQFKVDGTNIGAEVTAAPYTVSLNTALLSAGSHTISAVARDAAGNTATATVNVTVLLSTSDVTPPTVSITSPSNGSTVSGTITLNASATDNVGVAGVQFTVDGVNAGSEITSAPYTATLNTAQYTNASHVIAAIARDAAGNKSTASVTVTVSNSTPPPSGSSDLVIFQESLASPWINNSWSASVTFNSTEQKYAGSYSIKTALSAAWGAFSVHYGPWGSTGVTTSSYNSVDFMVYSPTTGTKLSVMFENDGGLKFPAVNVGTIAANQWNRISIPMSQLNPNNYVVNRFDIQDVSGSVKTFYVDNLQFTGTTVVPPPPAVDTTKPSVALTSPANGATLSGTVTVNANASDDRKLSGVQFTLNGANLGNEVTAAPYSVSWNTTTVANGTHTLSAIARDSAGNTNSVSVTVTVSNVTEPPPPSSDAVVFDDSLRSPWMNTSWNATATFGSTEQKYSGNNSIKVVQNAWGGLRLHSGSWSSPAGFNNNDYTEVTFAVHGGPSGVSMGVWLGNDNGSTFPAVKYIWVPANQWMTFSYPMTKLNPNNLTVHSLTIQDMTGRVKTFYVDEVKFVSKTQSLAKGVAGTAGEIDAAPLSFGLEQNYPNPFNPTTAIRYSVPFTASVTLEVYNTAGQRVALLVNQEQSAGEYGATFDGSALSSGVYFYRLTATNLEEPQAKPLVLTKRMIMMK